MIGVVSIVYSDLQKRIKRRKIRFKLFLFLIIFSLLIILLFTTPIFKVKGVVVSGNKIVAENRIIELSEIKSGDNLLKLDTDRVCESILTNPYIEEVKVKRSFLGIVYLEVTERNGTGIAAFDSKFVTIDKNGVVIEILDSRDDLNLPIIVGLNIKDAIPGKAVNLMNERQLNALKIIFNSITTSDLFGIINEVDISNLLSIMIKTNYGVNIKIGSTENVDSKLALSYAIIEQDIKKKGLRGTLDLSFDGNPIFRQE